MNYASETGTFATSHIPSGYTLQYNATQLDLVQKASVWATAAGGSRAAAANWTPAGVPNARGASRRSMRRPPLPFTITLDGPQTVGSLLLGNSASSTAGYTLSPGSAGTLTLDNSGSVATITVTDGSHVISAPVILAAGLTVTPFASATLTISGNVSQTGPRGLTLSGPGRLVLGGSNRYSGGTTISGGSLDRQRRARRVSGQPDRQQ